MADTATWLTAGATLGLAGAALGALGLALAQVRTTRREAKVDRTVNLHRDATTGEVQAAKRRLGAMLWAVGERTAGRRDVCYQPRFDEFRPAVAGVDRGGKLASYPARVRRPHDELPLDDVYCILHSFERLHAAHTKKTLADDLFESFAWDICRWSKVFALIQRSDTVRVTALHDLANAYLPRLTREEKARLGDTGFVRARVDARSP